MMGFYEFASNSPILTFLIVAGFVTAFRLVACRLLRTINILARGWPPPHLDADGNWKPEKEQIEERQ